MLLRYDWRGNVRELENAMERAVALARSSRVELEDLPGEIRRVLPEPVVTSGAVRTLEDIEKAYILSVLELNSGTRPTPPSSSGSERRRCIASSRTTD